MKPNPVHRLPAPLETAVQRLKLAAREAAERTIESLGLAALASGSAIARDGLLGAQLELNRKSAVFVLTFNEAFDDRVLRELGPQGTSTRGGTVSPASPAATNWDALSLVEDREVEAQISAKRFGLEIAHACEWELRELDGFVGALLAEAGGERDRNPLRPELVGQAMIKGIEAVSERAETRKVLSAELSRSLGGLLPATYADIAADLRGAGVQPLGMAVRARPSRSVAGGLDSTHGGPESHGGGLYPDASALGQGRTSGGASLHDSRYGSRQASGFGASTRSGGMAGGRRGTPLGQVDPGLMTLIRRLAFTNGGGVGDPGYADFGDVGSPMPNLIRAHRDELRQASTGSLDHMVIDVIGFLFDQILSDPKVPPQMARQIARLQLPVLRAALGDPSFFSSRKHPVRRFINRIASLGAAFEDFDEAGGKELLDKVRALVQEVVEGDFDQIEPYEQKLAALESFIAEASTREANAQGNAAELLSEKEDQLRLRQLYAQRLAGELKDVTAPPFLRDFLSKVWSQAMLRAAEQGGADGELAKRLRNVGRDLFLSVQPKATPALRKAFLAELPKLMQDLSEGMNLIAWPEAQRRAFFGQLMPAHAEALKSAPVRALDINLMARKVEGALHKPLPSREELRTAVLPVLTDEIEPPRFTPEEAQRVGLMPESAVDWNGPIEADVDIDLSADPAPAVAPGVRPLPGMPALVAGGEPGQPTQGPELADHMQIGFAYQMHLDGQWQKVRLAHVSAARSFFIFTHGGRHKKTVSLTRRMVQRLCEGSRLRAFETDFLIERATERTRRQLAAVGGTQSAPA